MTRSERRTRIFDLGARAFDGICPDAPHGYVCPICLRGFTEPEGLTVEHVPPKSHGGRPLCLTCKECNSLGGHTVDAAMAEEARIREFGQRTGRKYAVKFRVGSSEVNAEVTRSEQGTHIDVPHDRNDPMALPGFQSRLKEVLDGEGTFHLETRASTTRRAADIGYLRTAYLVAFAKLGYRYILTDALTPVRRQILDPESRSLPHLRVYEHGQAPQTRRLILIDEPVLIVGVQVGAALVFLPRDGSTCDDIQEWLREARGESPRGRIKGVGTMLWPTGPEFWLDLHQQGD